MTKLTNHVADMTPDELTALKQTVKEFMERLSNIDNEIETLKDDRKELLEEFGDRLDMKTLKAAMRVVKIQSGVAHRDSFDKFIEVLTDPSV